MPNTGNAGEGAANAEQRGDFDSRAPGGLPLDGRLTIGTLAFAMMLASLGTSIANIALPTLASAFSAPFSAVQPVVVAYLAALTVSSVVVGRLGDILGLRRVYLAGFVAFALGSALCGLSMTLPLLVAARVLQGFGAAVMMTLSMALIRQLSAKDRMGRAMGLLGTVSALGTALGPTLGGLLIAAAGWRAIFLVQVPLALAALVLAILFLPEARPAPKTGAQTPWTRLAVALAPNLAVNLLVAAVMMTTLVIGPFDLAGGLGLEAALVGVVMSAGPVAAIASGVPAGRAVDAWGAPKMLGAGLILLGAGALLLAVLPGMAGVWGYVAALVVLTPGYQLFQAANNTMTLADVPAEARGLASGLLALSRNAGLIVGASVMGRFFAFAVGSSTVAGVAPAQIAEGARLTFLLAGAMVGLAIVISVARAGLAVARSAEQVE